MTVSNSKTPKSVRQNLIVELLQTSGAATQSQIAQMLAEQGVKTTQVTVSRDLDELGATKVKLPANQAGFAYTLEPQAMSLSKTVQGRLRRVLREWVYAIEKSRDLVILSTAPGAAHVVAAALDRSKHPGVLATLSGDDTVLVIATEACDPSELQAQLTELAELDK